MSFQSDCDFCQESRGLGSRVVFDDGNLVVLSARFQRPNNLGQMLVVPKDHVVDLHDASDELARDVFSLVRRTSKAVLHATGATGITLRQNSGPPGQEVFHLHVHVFPRFPDDAFLTSVQQPTPAERVEHLVLRVSEQLGH